jgi:hypothetical protein
VGRIPQPAAEGKKKPSVKRTPNPNVMIELGYAARSRGWDRIIPIMNTSGGTSPEQLPFDLRHRRWPITYRLDDPNGPEKADVRAQLSRDIERELRNLLPRVNASLGVREERAQEIRDSFHEDVRAGRFAGIDPSGGVLAITVIPQRSSDRRLVLKEIERSLLNRFEAIGGGLLSRPGGGFHRNYYLMTDNQTVTRATEIDERGIIRAVTADIYVLRRSDNELPRIPSGSIEVDPVQALCNYVAGLRALEIHGPVWLDFALLNLAKATMALRTGAFHPGHSFEGGRDIVPGIVLCDPEGDPSGIPQAIAKALQNAYDFLWREFGFPKSPNFDVSGTWHPPGGG